MGFLHISEKDFKALVALVRPGKFVLIYENPDRWGVFKCAAKVTILNTPIIVDRSYEAPGVHERIDISEYYERNTLALKAVYDTKEEADAVAERMIALINTFKSEIAAPTLKLEMGISVLLAQR